MERSGPARNAPCPCGSGKRYKHCHGALQRPTWDLPGVEETQRRMRQEIPLLGASEPEMRNLRSVAEQLAEKHAPALEANPAFAFFIGYPRSAHSLIGAVIDAHPDAICAHELDVLKFLAAGFTRRQIEALLIENAALAGKAGRRWGPYSYAIPGQAQGTCRKLKILADKKGGTTTQRLLRDPAELDRLLQAFGNGVKVIHVIRNPFDVIATNRQKHVDDLQGMTELFFARAAANAAVRERLGPQAVLDLYHEDTLEAPRENFQRLFEHLGLEADEPLLQACAALVEPPGSLARHRVTWPPSAKLEIRARCQEVPFLAHYDFG